MDPISLLLWGFICVGIAGIVGSGSFLVIRKVRRRRGHQPATERTASELDRVTNALWLLRNCEYELGSYDPTRLVIQSLQADLGRYERVVRADNSVMILGLVLVVLINVLQSLLGYMDDGGYMTSGALERQRALIKLKGELLHLSGLVYKGTSRAVRGERSQNIGTLELVTRRQHERRSFRALEKK